MGVGGEEEALSEIELTQQSQFVNNLSEVSLITADSINGGVGGGGFHPQIPNRGKDEKRGEN